MTYPQRPSTLVRVVMWLLAVPNIITGAWAVIAPEHWFDNYPGWAPDLVAAYPPYNEHLATDAGAGLLSTGVVMALAAVWGKREVVIAAAVAFLAFSLPHFLFHLLSPSEELSASEEFPSTAALALAVVGPVFVLLWQWRPVSESSPGESEEQSWA